MNDLPQGSEKKCVEVIRTSFVARFEFARLFHEPSAEFCITPLLR